MYKRQLSYGELEKLKYLMVIMIANIAIAMPNSVYSSIISAYEQFVFAKLYAILGTVLVPVFNLIVLYSGYASIGMALVSVAFQITSSVVYSIFCIKKLGLCPSFDNMPVHLVGEIWKFSAFVFLSSITDMLYWATDKVLIGATIGAAAVAVYNVGGTFTSMLQNMAHSISNMFTPKVMMIAQRDSNTESVSELMIRVGRLQFYIVSFILSGYIVFGKSFLRLWAGVGYEEAYYLSLIHI